MLTYLTKKKENNKHLMSQYGINRINILNELINKKPIKKKTSNDSKKPLSMAKTTTTNTRNSQNERVSNTNTVNLIPQSRNKNVKRHVSIDTKSTLNDKTKRCIEYSIRVKKLNMTNTSNIVIPQTKKSEVSSNKKSRNAKNRSNISYKNSVASFIFYLLTSRTFDFCLYIIGYFIHIYFSCMGCMTPFFFI